MIRISRLAVYFLPLLLLACFDQSSVPEIPPINLTVTPGENKVVLYWDNVPGLDYWVYYKAGSLVTTTDYDFINSGYASPAIIGGLLNGVQYSFIVNASNNGSKTGPITSVVTVTPRLLGPTVPWNIGAQLSSNSLNGIAYANNYYVAVGDAATVLIGPHDYTYANGVIEWSPATALPIGAGTNLTSVIYDGVQFIALGSDGSITLTTDEIKWIARTAIVNGPPMHAMATNSAGPSDYVYVAVGDGGAIYRNTTGGMTGPWSAVSSGTAQNLYGVSYFVIDSAGIYVAVGAAGTLVTSPDGLTWTVQNSHTNNTLRHVTYGVPGTGVGTIVAVGDVGTIVSSTDAINWSVQSSPTTQSFNSVAFGPDLQFIAAGTEGTLAYSTTGSDGSWSVGNAGSIDLNSIAPEDVYIAVGAAGANVSGK